MGRLLRKKDSAQKKKKAPGSLEASSEGGVGASVTVSAGTDLAKGGQPRAASVKKNALGDAALKIKYLDQAVQFLREVKIELKKVVWPSRKQTVASTVVVIVLVLLVSLFLGIVDLGLSSLIKVVLS